MKKHATNEQHFHPQIHYSIKKDFDFDAYEMVELHVGDYRYYKICACVPPVYVAVEVREAHHSLYVP